MTQSLGMDENGDIYLSPNGRLALLDAEEAVRSACLNAVRAQRGEMVLQTASGLPTDTLIWGGRPNPLAYESFIRQAILDVNGVLSIQSLSSKVQNGVFSYEAIIVTEFGQVNING